MYTTRLLLFECFQHHLVRRVRDTPGEHGAHKITADALVEQLDIAVLQVVDHSQRFEGAEELSAKARLHVRLDHVERVEERGDERAEEATADEVVERVVQLAFSGRQELLDPCPRREEHHVG